MRWARPTRYIYDRRGRHSATVLPDGARYDYGRDGAGRRIRFGSGETAVTHEWDELGRVLCARNPAGHERRFEYDPAGRLVALINENGARSRFAYDVMDRLVRETGFDGRCRDYHYDLSGELTGIDEAGAAPCACSATKPAACTPANTARFDRGLARALRLERSRPAAARRQRERRGADPL